MDHCLDKLVGEQAGTQVAGCNDAAKVVTCAHVNIQDEAATHKAFAASVTSNALPSTVRCQLGPWTSLLIMLGAIPEI